jgi:hypothetical protein
MGPTDPSGHRNLKLRQLKSEMTLLLDVPTEDADRDREGCDPEGVELNLYPGGTDQHPVVVFDPSSYIELLEDCELSAWAKQAGAKYLISELDALWLLAQALLLDGQSSEACNSGSTNYGVQADGA